jgi:hypothetical protein
VGRIRLFLGRIRRFLGGIVCSLLLGRGSADIANYPQSGVTGFIKVVPCPNPSILLVERAIASWLALVRLNFEMIRLRYHGRGIHTTIVFCELRIATGVKAFTTTNAIPHATNPAESSIAAKPTASTTQYPATPTEGIFST